MGWAEPVVVTSVAQFYGLDRETCASGVEVRIQGVVTYTDREWSLLFLQDDTGALTLGPRGEEVYPQPGDRVEVTGRTSVENQAYCVVQQKVRILGQQALPQPLRVQEEDLLTSRVSAQWAELTCVVRQSVRQGDRLRLELLKGKTRLVSYVRAVPSREFNSDSLVGAFVRVQGVCALRYKDNRIDSVGLFIPGLSNIQVESPSVPLDTMPVIPIHDLINRSAIDEGEGRTRVQGVVVANRGSSFVLKDPTGTIMVFNTRTPVKNVDDRLDVWGFPEIVNQQVVLQDAVYRPLTDMGGPLAGSGTDADAESTGTIRLVRDVRGLSKVQASRRPSVLLQGIVTYADSDLNNFFLQDETGAVFVQGWLDGLKAGLRVEVEGVTDPGFALPFVTDVRVRPLGDGVLPRPLRLNLKDLRSLDYDCVWVEQEGVVREVNDAPAHAVLAISSPQGAFNAVLPDPSAGMYFRHLVNAWVRVRGVVAIQMNNQDQISGIEIRVPDSGSIQVLAPAPSDPFSEPVRAIGSVRNGNLELLGLQRLHIRGMVTLIAPGERYCLQDTTGGIWVSTAQEDVFPIGETLDVVGFPVSDGSSIHLDDAILRVTGEKEHIKLKTVLASDILTNGLDDDLELVEMEGRLLNATGGIALPTLIVQGQSGIFEARFETRDNSTQFPIWQAESLVRLTGVCSIQRSENGEPRSFVLLLRNQDDVQVLQVPPWWTPRYAISFGGGLVVLILLALGWAILLQRKVREHTEQIRLRIEAETAVGRRFSLVWENSVDGMRLSNADGEVIQVNKAYCELVQRSREELEGHNLEVVYPESDRERLLSLYRDEFPRRAISPRREGEMTLWNGQTFWFEQTNTFFELPGQPLLLFSQLRDITERKRAEEVVRTQIVALTRPLDDPAGIQFGDLFNIEEIQSIQDSFANATGVASIITQPDGTPITRPSNFCRLCQEVIRKTEKGLANCYKSDATLGCSNPTGPIIRPCLSGGLWDAGASINVGGKHIANWLIGQARDPGQDDEEMLQYADVIGADREEFRRALAEVPVMSRQQFSQVANMLFSFASELSLKAYQNVQQARFITERNHAEEEKERLQAQLLQAQKMEAVGQLAGGVAHDFNNLLAVILGYGELIETGLPENSPWREEVLQIISAALRAKDLTRQLLAFSRKQVLEMKPVDLNLLVENMEKMMRRLLGENIELLVILAPGLGRVKADTTQLQQVMLNLCVNARDAMPTGGVLTIETQSVPFAEEKSVARPATLQPCPYVLLSISDTGHGMDVKTQRRIFEPFFTTKEVGKGTGLGLATAYGIVKQHGGEILVESLPGHGSVFKVFLPEVLGDREDMQGDSPEGPSEGRGEVILVVEDEQVVRELTCRMLTSLGYRVIEACEPEQCVEIARDSGPIDLLLTDVIMPGLNGRQVYEQIKSIRPGLKVLFMSGYTDDVIANQGILEQGVHLINKPFKAADLNRVIREVLRT